MRSFNPKTDLIELNCWLIARNAGLLDEKDLPKMGQIVPGVACGFIVTTDCSTCFLECFVSNKDASKKDREDALEKIARWGEKMAAILGYKRLLAITEAPTLLKLAENMGFEFKNIKLASMDL